MKRFGTSEQQLHVEVYPQEKLHPQFRKSSVILGVLGSVCSRKNTHLTCVPHLLTTAAAGTWNWTARVKDGWSVQISVVQNYY